MYYLMTIPVGAGVGAVVGALTLTERWEPVSGSGAALHVWTGGERTTVMVTGRF